MPANAAVVAYANVGRRDAVRVFRERLQRVMPDEDKAKGRRSSRRRPGSTSRRTSTPSWPRWCPARAKTSAPRRHPRPLRRGPHRVPRPRARRHGGRLLWRARHQHAGEDGGDGADAAEPPERRARPSEPKVRRRPIRANFHPAMAFVEPGLMLFGSEEGGEAGLAQRQGRPEPHVEHRDDERGSRGWSASANAWAIGRFDALAETGRAAAEQVAAQMPPLTWFEAAGHVNGGLRGTLRAETKDEASAQNLRDMINGLDGAGADAGAEQAGGQRADAVHHPRRRGEHRRTQLHGAGWS